MDHAVVKWITLASLRQTTHIIPVRSGKAIHEDREGMLALS